MGRPWSPELLGGTSQAPFHTMSWKRQWILVPKQTKIFQYTWFSSKSAGKFQKKCPLCIFQQNSTEFGQDPETRDFFHLNHTKIFFKSCSQHSCYIRKLHFDVFWCLKISEIAIFNPTVNRSRFQNLIKIVHPIYFTSF